MPFQVVKPTFAFYLKFRSKPRDSHLSLIALALVFLLVIAGPRISTAAPLPFWQSITLTGNALACLDHAGAERIAVVACNDACRPIPWQLDERDAQGRLCLDQGPQPNRDDPEGVVDENDELLWMADDAGRRMRAEEIPEQAPCVLEVRQRFAGTERWTYVFSLPDEAPRSAVRYVEYDPRSDVVTGARVGLGFGAPTPEFFALRPPPGEPWVNLLDRLKVRASARFFGIIPLSRDEGDLRTDLLGWKVGPVRVVRRQRQWVVLGWGLRTPIFHTDTLFYRDYAHLPVHLRLNFPPTYFFSGIEVLGVLDFRNLAGWRLLGQGMTESIPLSEIDERQRDDLNRRPGDWFALLGPSVTLVQMLTTSDSLSSLKRTLVFREESDWQKPERWKGENPGVGYRLTDWGDVDGGHHWFASTSYALPAGYDVREFIAQLDEQPVVTSKELPRRP